MLDIEELKEITNAYIKELRLERRIFRTGQPTNQQQTQQASEQQMQEKEGGDSGRITYLPSPEQTPVPEEQQEESKPKAKYTKVENNKPENLLGSWKGWVRAPAGAETPDRRSNNALRSSKIKADINTSQIIKGKRTRKQDTPRLAYLVYLGTFATIITNTKDLKLN